MPLSSTSRRRRAALAVLLDPSERAQGRFEVTVAGAPALAVITSFSFRVVPLGHGRGSMVAPAIAAIRSVELRRTRRRVQVTVTTEGGAIEVSARPHVAEQIVDKLLGHRHYKGTQTRRL